MRRHYVVRIDPSHVGWRVSVRTRTYANPPATDTVGVLRAWEDGILTIERRNGSLVHIRAEDLLAGRVVPDQPPRRRPRP